MHGMVIDNWYRIFYHSCNEYIKLRNELPHCNANIAEIHKS